jgi:hypothetical protein
VLEHLIISDACNLFICLHASVDLLASHSIAQSNIDHNSNWHHKNRSPSAPRRSSDAPDHPTHAIAESNGFQMRWQKCDMKTCRSDPESAMFVNFRFPDSLREHHPFSVTCKPSLTVFGLRAAIPDLEDETGIIPSLFLAFSHQDKTLPEDTLLSSITPRSPPVAIDCSLAPGDWYDLVVNTFQLRAYFPADSTIGCCRTFVSHRFSAAYDSVNLALSPKRPDSTPLQRLSERKIVCDIDGFLPVQILIEAKPHNLLLPAKAVVSQLTHYVHAKFYPQVQKHMVAMTNRDLDLTRPIIALGQPISFRFDGPDWSPGTRLLRFVIAGSEICREFSVDCPVGFVRAVLALEYGVLFDRFNFDFGMSDAALVSAIPDQVLRVESPTLSCQFSDLKRTLKQPIVSLVADLKQTIANFDPFHQRLCFGGESVDDARPLASLEGRPGEWSIQSKPTPSVRLYFERDGEPWIVRDFQTFWDVTRCFPPPPGFVTRFCLGDEFLPMSTRLDDLPSHPKKPIRVCFQETVLRVNYDENGTSVSKQLNISGRTTFTDVRREVGLVSRCPIAYFVSGSRAPLDETLSVLEANPGLLPIYLRPPIKTSEFSFRYRGKIIVFDLGTGATVANARADAAIYFHVAPEQIGVLLERREQSPNRPLDPALTYSIELRDSPTLLDLRASLRETRRTAADPTQNATGARPPPSGLPGASPSTSNPSETAIGTPSIAANGRPATSPSTSNPPETSAGTPSISANGRPATSPTTLNPPETSAGAPSGSVNGRPATSNPSETAIGTPSISANGRPAPSPSASRARETATVTSPPPRSIDVPWADVSDDARRGTVADLKFWACTRFDRDPGAIAVGKRDARGTVTLVSETMPLSHLSQSRYSLVLIPKPSGDVIVNFQDSHPADRDDLDSHCPSWFALAFTREQTVKDACQAVAHHMRTVRHSPWVVEEHSSLSHRGRPLAPTYILSRLRLEKADVMVHVQDVEDVLLVSVKATVS